MITFRVITYNGKHEDLAVTSGEPQAMVDFKKSFVESFKLLKEPFKVTEDWRDGKLFDILIERFNPTQGDI